MSNVHGLFSKRDDENDESDDPNNLRYVGGVSARGGGSGLAVEPNPNDQAAAAASIPAADGAPPRDSIFRLAENQMQEEDDDDEDEDNDGPFSPPQRRITMYRNGFMVDDGPYRRLDDPANADFLRALAMGRTPRELVEGNENVVVELIDKRSEDFVPPFQSFTGEGKILTAAATTTTTTTTTTNTDGRIDPSTITAPPTVDATQPTTTIPVRTSTGQRVIVTVNLSSTVQDLAAQLIHQQQQSASSTSPFVLQTGFPPRTITDLTQTVAEAGLQGGQVVQKLVS